MSALGRFCSPARILGRSMRQRAGPWSASSSFSPTSQDWWFTPPPALSARRGIFRATYTAQVDRYIQEIFKNNRCVTGIEFLGLEHPHTATPDDPYWSASGKATRASKRPRRGVKSPHSRRSPPIVASACRSLERRRRADAGAESGSMARTCYNHSSLIYFAKATVESAVGFFSSLFSS